MFQVECGSISVYNALALLSSCFALPWLARFAIRAVAELVWDVLHAAGDYQGNGRMFLHILAASNS